MGRLDARVFPWVRRQVVGRPSSPAKSAFGRGDQHAGDVIDDELPRGVELVEAGQQPEQVGGLVRCDVWSQDFLLGEPSSPKLRGLRVRISCLTRHASLPTIAICSQENTGILQ